MLKAIGISGSLRKASSNTGLLRYAQTVMPAGMTLDLVDIAQVPLFNADLGDAETLPAVSAVLRRIGDADALVLAVPEYNYSVAPALKNVLDWASRAPGNQLLKGKPVALMGAAGGMGSSRAQYHLRQTCVFLDLLPLNKPEVFANAYAGFSADGDPVDPVIQDNVRAQMEALLGWTRRLQGDENSRARTGVELSAAHTPLAIAAA
jgi:chromate reductase